MMTPSFYFNIGAKIFRLVTRRNMNKNLMLAFILGEWPLRVYTNCGDSQEQKRWITLSISILQKMHVLFFDAYFLQEIVRCQPSLVHLKESR